MQKAPLGAFCNTLDLIKPPFFMIKIFVLSFFEWPFYTDFTVPSRLVYTSSEDSDDKAMCTKIHNLMCWLLYFDIIHTDGQKKRYMQNIR